MIDRIHQKLGTAGFVIAIVALVAALGGGAYAAKTGLTGKQKKEVQKIAKKEAKKFAKAGKPGKNGAPGATGTAGPAGTGGAKGDRGDAGAPGAPGSAGAAGKSVVTGDLSPGLECEEGGAYVEVEGSGVKRAVCNGVEGSPWPAGGLLPSGQTETGSYGGYYTTGQQGFMPISFTLPVEPAPTGEYVTGSSTANCPGVVDGVPTAEPGFLCLYKGLATAGTVLGFLKPLAPGTEEGIAPSGADFAILCASASCSWTGTWAVTAG